ncbi:MAG: lactonase family protein, partial [Planctomycetaceae bacterium]|nr:lactonase family protein [Planctomycetaceae bacterium]
MKPACSLPVRFLLTCCFALTVCSLPLSAADPEKPLMAYVGTFSSPLKDVLKTQVDLPPGNGRGIHLFEVNRETGALSSAGEVRMGTSPSCVLVNGDGTRLYSANETDRYQGTKEGTVSSFSIDQTTGQLTLMNTVPSGGAGPTYVYLHPTGNFLFVANYFGGSVAVLPIQADGSLGKATDVKVDEGHIGPTKAEHAPPGSFAISGHDRTHAHQILTDPTGQYVLHVDLAQDRIYIWQFDMAQGELVPHDQPYVSLPPGDGPRHVHFHPNGKWFYSIQEEGSTVVFFDWNPETGHLTERQTLSTLPKGFSGSNFCSE